MWLKVSQRIAAAANATPSAYIPTPLTSQTAKYPIAIRERAAAARLVFKNVGSADGSIMATIIASHMSRKLVAEANQFWPGIRIHIMDIVQPPGISISQHIERQK